MYNAVEKVLLGIYLPFTSLIIWSISTLKIASERSFFSIVFIEEIIVE